ncbi:hypothetical protein QMA69_12150 [Burkholderia pseudomallei]|nr:hypothetical protein [Burkholderia pseudomallei]MEB5504093.1 hypothetical protein [Burkholderia pseudomallei]MEB5510109.1 hypothetical protein [Burkholderia pseudomallei]
MAAWSHHPRENPSLRLILNVLGVALQFFQGFHQDVLIQRQQRCQTIGNSGVRRQIVHHPLIPIEAEHPITDRPEHTSPIVVLLLGDVDVPEMLEVECRADHLPLPTLHRLQQLSDALDCSVDQLLQRGSKRPDDQLAMIADALSGLDGDERELVVNFVQQLADMLRAKHPRRGQRKK